jgi:hypothetical protein
MPPLAPGLDYVDLNFLGRPEIIATAILHGPAGVALVDPGPTTSLDHLTTALTRKGIRFEDVRQILLTHIHLDHAGATGSILAKFPHIEVFVHQRGAPHLADPSKLIASAGRLYQQDMDRLWGEVKPVDFSRLRPIDGGERLTVWAVFSDRVYARSASHHVAYYDGASRVALARHTAGIRRGAGAMMPPPPDIDPEAAPERQRSGAGSATPFLTHFVEARRAAVLSGDVREHEPEPHRPRLLADASIDDEERQRRFVDEAFSRSSGARGDWCGPCPRAGSTIRVGGKALGANVNTDEGLRPGLPDTLSRAARRRARLRAHRCAQLGRRLCQQHLALTVITPPRRSYARSSTAVCGSSPAERRGRSADDVATHATAAGYRRQRDVVSRRRCHRMERRALLSRRRT